MKIRYTFLIFFFTIFVNAQSKNIIEKKGNNSDDVYRLGEDKEMDNAIFMQKNHCHNLIMLLKAMTQY